MSQRIIIVDFYMGNLNSIKRKVSRIGHSAMISSSQKDILNAEKIIIPGVGHFQQAVENIKKIGLWDVLNEAALVKKIPILGICLGMQLMSKHSEEGDIDGLNWFNAEVIKFHVNNSFIYKVPHTGWNQIIKTKESFLMKDIPELSEFYFVHSYHLKCKNESDILNETEYEYKFTSAIEKDNIFGVQYHPEKSHDIGEKLLRNFINI